MFSEVQTTGDEAGYRNALEQEIHGRYSGDMKRYRGDEAGYRNALEQGMGRVRTISPLELPESSPFLSSKLSPLDLA